MEETKKVPIYSYFEKNDFNEILKIIKDKNASDVKELIESVEKFVRGELSGKKKITYTQLRSIYQIVKDKTVENDVAAFMLTALPKLAYIEARQEEEPKKMVTFIRGMATSVNNEVDYKAFIDFMTALVAYHKLNEKKSS